MVLLDLLSGLCLSEHQMLKMIVRIFSLHVSCLAVSMQEETLLLHLDLKSMRTGPNPNEARLRFQCSLNRKRSEDSYTRDSKSSFSH